MIYRAADIRSAELLEYDLCIIGAGPAGMVLCAEMLYSGLRICVIESGFLDTTLGPSPLTDSLRATETRGINIPRVTYERVVGGATKAWEGICALIYPINPEKRPFPPHERWPIGYAELLPHFATAAERYCFPSVEAFQHDMRLRPRWETLEEKINLQQIEPVRLGRKFRYIFERKNVDLLLEATALSLQSSQDAGGACSVHHAVCRTRDDKVVRIASKSFVLAAGSIENPRILLNSKGANASIGNEHDQVGRYLMGHLDGFVGTLHFEPSSHNWDYFLRTPFKKYNKYSVLSIKKPMQEEKKLLNCSLELKVIPPWQSVHTIHAKKHVHQILSYLRAVKRAIKERVGVARTVRDLPTSLLALCKLLLNVIGLPRYAAERLLYALRPFFRKAHIYFRIEMEPRAENRVTLSERSDSYGIPIPLVEHQTSARDIASAEILLSTFQKECLRLAIGNVVLDANALPTLVKNGSKHHAGTTRMGLDPKTSVVNLDLRVHSVSNLYIAGASVFPTSGYADPIMTTVALSIRLAKHLLATQTEISNKTQAQIGKPSAKSVLIIGSGPRVTQDVVPAFETLEDKYWISHIVARTQTIIFGRKRSYAVRPIDEMSAADIKETDLVYIAVPTQNLQAVLEHLVAHQCAHLDLIIDTPAISSKRLRELYENFQRVHIAEDSVFLPWLDAVRAALRDNGSLGTLKKIVIDRSAYRYHGIALIKALCLLDGPRQTRDVIRAGVCFLHHAFLICCGGIRAILVGPYRQRGGSLLIIGKNGSASDKKSKGSIQIECLEDRAVCCGFRLSASESRLTAAESELIGRWEPSYTILTHMNEIKRVGLSRLLRAAASGNTWTLSEGLEDAAIIQALERFGIFFRR